MLEKLLFQKIQGQAPFKEMKKELQSIKHLSQSKPEGIINLEGGELVYQGLKSLCLYGWGPEKTLPSKYYKEDQEKEKIWVFEEECPVTTNFLKNLVLGHEHNRARVQFLRPGGILEPHKDNHNDNLSVLIVNICHPKGCEFIYDDNNVEIPICDGDIYMVNPGQTHSVKNNGIEDRISIVLSGDFKDLLK